jgi:hypothetical protein
MTNLIINFPKRQEIIFPKIAGRIIQREPVPLVEITCPQCGRVHRHGIGGSDIRLSHCIDVPPILYQIVVIDSEEVIG